MSKNSYGGFSRRGPDWITEELVAVLSRKTSFEFKALFEIVHSNLRERKAASGGEEMLRLRAYEKLQNLVQAGIVKKTGKKYRGLANPILDLKQQIKNWQPADHFAKAISAQ
jgi:hypothetical protein